MRESFLSGMTSAAAEMMPAARRQRERWTKVSFMGSEDGSWLCGPSRIITCRNGEGDD